jgi:tetratricopeptide (TPR) repeat protein
MQDEFLLKRQEAAEQWDLLGGAAGFDEAFATSAGMFLPFHLAARRVRGLPPILVPQPNGASFHEGDASIVDAARLVDALHMRGAAAEALEAAVRLGAPLTDSLVADGAQHLADRGLFQRLYGIISQVPSAVREKSEVLMTWYFIAATAVNDHVSVRREVQEYLKHAEAPDLRALYAGAFPGPEMLDETERALRASVTPVTLRLRAFALAQSPEAGDAGPLLMRALRLAEALGRHDMVMACAVDLSDYWLRRGSYADAGTWAQWALDWFVSNGLKDDIRRLVALGLSCYARLMIGNTVGLQGLVEELHVPADGIPTTEVAISTKADWHFHNGNFAEAVALYRRNVEAASLGQMHHAALDLVHGLIHVASYNEAHEVASRIVIFAKGADSLTRSIAALATGLALSPVDGAKATHWLAEAQAILREEVLAPRLAQATIALAKLHLRSGSEAEALKALEDGEPALRELGFTGWTLLGGFDPEVKTLYQLFRGESTELELHFLGETRITFKGTPVELGLRQQEILAVLAARPNGTHAERLGLEVYGESAHLSTLKAIVSRLRQSVPIENKPYRIGVAVWSDFIEMERLLEAGRVREALSLYRGPLLPRSEAPAIVEMRDHLDESLRRSVLRSGDVEALLQLAKLFEADLELYEAALERISPNDPRFPVVRARLEQVRRNW